MLSLIDLPMKWMLPNRKKELLMSLMFEFRTKLLSYFVLVTNERNLLLKTSPPTTVTLLNTFSRNVKLPTA